MFSFRLCASVSPLQLAPLSPHQPPPISQSQCHTFWVSKYLSVIPMIVSYLYLIMPQIRQQDFGARGLPFNLQNIYYVFQKHINLVSEKIQHQRNVKIVKSVTQHYKMLRKSLLMFFAYPYFFIKSRFHGFCVCALGSDNLVFS